MIKKYSIDFIEEKKKVEMPVTKFGGQPIWIDKAQWPIDEENGKPMRFICQIELYPEIFGESKFKMAYLFVSKEWNNYVVICQPSNTKIVTNDIVKGPTIYKMVEKKNSSFLVPQGCEFTVNLILGEDYNFVHQSPYFKGDELVFEESPEDYNEILDGNKIGGTPLFLNCDELPEGDMWKLLLQLDATKLPFELNFGDAGMGFFLINMKDNNLKFIIESC
ncbi:DUF1963 domain-containing protein [Clostridium sp. OS1-26]|uniref:DUF1963 domain-containing protein n=1 Tax=Clostridium sp. OS1-26 TaxID=3070681 RepID=UPI0027E19664|nr:DUF1963 domain-containing protein [Clostridium sp. OS1-26]WML33316.1 DUF1963 domain-containing protein [Clostridium sp. OS1-26]